MTEYLIFYSWQSDLPNSTNRNFIEDALKKAVNDMKKNGDFLVDPVIDRDTAGVPGSPNIAETILHKIDEAQVFVCDISIINNQFSDKSRATPNPNVLFELGYAVKSLGKTERIILVMNTAFGKPEMLPFDLKMQRVTTYNIPQDATPEKRLEEKKNLAKRLKQAVAAIISGQGTRIPNGYVEVDRQLFNKIRKIIPSDGSIRFIRECDYGGRFLSDSHKDIMDFENEFKYPNPENEFFDLDLQESLENLAQKVDNFLRAIGKHTFVDQFNSDWNRIAVDTDIDVQLGVAAKTQSEEDYKNGLEEVRQRSYEIRDKINILAQNLCDAYDEFVRLGRNKLAI